MPVGARLDEAMTILRREGGHLATNVDINRTPVGVVALEDLVEEYVGTVRDTTRVDQRNPTVRTKRPTPGGHRIAPRLGRTDFGVRSAWSSPVDWIRPLLRKFRNRHRSWCWDNT
ncbi:hypothetical protein MOQ72_20170 [Saccharopolyspora sp. K220]|uniref:hypothetical protein n=1 Tax=Saccharopolyspora soli TaxID=2926618 RepID=UPI001F583882|nr:hypothetical protein [Saccharopolyspora soli]MCI2419767.1 hypothetical protein [Saccharopolyspora soli]